MARLIAKEKNEVNTIMGGVPYYGYGIEADTYKEAEALAKALFHQDLIEEANEAFLDNMALPNDSIDDMFD
jgi:hypothetical protein